MNTKTHITLLASVGILALAAATGCGGGGGGGAISADGSSTVGPFTTKAAEDFRAENPDVQVTVGISGTGGGFERFCAGETDISDASRAIDEEEAASCEGNGIEYVELQVATDALTNVVNIENDWATCLTVEQLNTIWKPGSTVTNWNQIDPSFPDVELKLYGAGTDSGTFDYFTDAINGEEGASRSDYSATEDDNVTVQGVAGDKGALGYFGFSYFEENQDKLKALEVDDGQGCVAPSATTAQDGSYQPLSRPLFMYVKTSSLADSPSLGDFVRYTLENEQTIAQEAKFVPLSQEQIDEQLQKLEGATA
ncbi:MAG TPA: PstS family phosphate ABC transporter substrate-binding protein [Gaiellaceae bacterium]|nr:PstS family phosphate ABC transporter substrate-binding protein [Gaiellaceae bacterium]HLG08731.1 PstS family phosphate ABC transporter substrate-binding protein [Gaiellaceae bacterium]